MSTQKNTFPVDSEARRLETFKALQTLALELFKALNLLNAGAAAGMLGGMDKLQTIIERGAIEISIVSFVLGLVFGLSAMLTGWLALYRRLHLTDKPNPDPAKYKRWMIATLLIAALGLACFCFGALIAVTHLQPATKP